MTTTTTAGRVSRAQREIEVAGLVRAGLSREDIAAQLGLTEDYVGGIIRRLGLGDDRTAAITVAGAREPGIYPGIPDEEYHGDRGSLSSSGARLLLPPSVPALFRHAMDTPRPPTRVFDFGHIAHRLLLGEGARFEVLHPEVVGLLKDGSVAASPRATAGWKQAEKDAREAGRVPVHADDHAKAEAMVSAVRRHETAGPLFAGGRAEVSLFAEDPETGVRLRARPDWWTEVDGRATFVDFKGLSLDTPIPTPSGWSNMGDLRVGDEVFAADGSVCRVTAKSSVHWKDCYRMTFDDQTSIVCDHDHLWSTRSGVHGSVTAKVITTADIAQTLRGSNGRRQHRITMPGPLQLPPAALPIDPYVLGVWLGDGSAAAGRVTKPDIELFDLVSARGYSYSPPAGSDPAKCPTRTIYGLQKQLREAGLLGHKHIPDDYLRSSIGQRLDLIRGLMDTDGTWNRVRNSVVFSSVDKALAIQVQELALSLGERATFHEYRASGFGKSLTAYRVDRNPQRYNPFALSRKADAVTMKGSVRSRQRVVHSCDQTVTVPTQCIQVDSVDSSYLCGEQMVPTHNTTVTAEPEAFTRKATRDFGYHVQAAFYRRAAALLGLGDVRFLFVAVEKTSPHLPSVVEFDAEALAEADRLVTQAVAKYAECTATNVWPGYPPGIHLASLPPWQLANTSRAADEDAAAALIAELEGIES